MAKTMAECLEFLDRLQDLSLIRDAVWTGNKLGTLVIIKLYERRIQAFLKLAREE